MSAQTINPQKDIFKVADIVMDVLGERRVTAIDRKVNAIAGWLGEQLVNQVRHSPEIHWELTERGYESEEVHPGVIESIARRAIGELFRGQWQVEFRANHGSETYVLAGTFPDAATAVLVGTYRIGKTFSEIKEMDGAEAPILSGKPTGLEIFRKNENGTDFRRYAISLPA